MTAKFALLPLLALATTFLFSSPAAAQCETNALITLSNNIQGITTKLQQEFRSHFSNSGAYRHLMSDIARVRAEAKHIEGLAERPFASLRHIKVDLQDLTELSQNLQEIIEAVERGRYSGNLDGDTAQSLLLLAAVNTNIHQMERVVTDFDQPASQEHYSSNDNKLPGPVDSIVRSLLRRDLR